MRTRNYHDLERGGSSHSRYRHDQRHLGETSSSCSSDDMYTNQWFVMESSLGKQMKAQRPSPGCAGFRMPQALTFAAFERPYYPPLEPSLA